MLLTGLRLAGGAALLLGLYLVGQGGRYLLFHSLADLFTVAVACSIFLIAWNARRLYENAYVLVLAIAYLFVSLLTILHVLAYRGMGVFVPDDANLPTQLWVALRALEVISLVLAPLALGRRLRAERVVAGYAVVTAGLLASIFWWRIFPDCYVEPTGLTAFKIGAEYVFAGLLGVAFALLWARRAAFDRSVLRWLLGAIVANFISGLAFTSYVSVYGPANAVGHLVRIVSFYCLYRAIVVTALRRPYELLFRELKAREEALEAAQRAREEMVQFVVHDLRSPLTSVLAGTDVLRSALPDTLDAGRRELVEATSVAGTWMLTLINSLLDASRLESGALKLQPTRVAVEDLLTPSLAQVRPWAELGQIRFVVERASSVQAVQADAEVTVRVLVNLLSNAVKFSPASGLVRVAVTADGDDVVFQVRDEGPGVPSDWTEKVFDRFAQVEARRAGGAVGLGLTFCRLAVEAQGGRIRLESAEGAGATVTFTLPAPRPGLAGPSPTA